MILTSASSRQRRRAYMFSALLVQAWPAVAHAQAGTTPDPAANKQQGQAAAVTPPRDQVTQGDIVVTATRRAETLQSVPLSITAITGADLTQRAANTFLDYATTVPNLSFGATGIGPSGSRSIAIRGIADSGYQTGGPTTGFYIDDTPVPNSLDPKVLDVARIEVLRGPQGTLYGGSSEGGTVRLITVQPDPAALSGRGHASVSGTDHSGKPNYQFDGALNIPIIDDALALRVSGLREVEAGYLRREIGPLGSDPTKVVKNVGDERTTAFSASLLAKPTHNLTITPRIVYQRSTRNGFPFYDVPADATDLGFRSFVQRREFDIPEISRDRWILSSVAINLDTAFGSFVSSTSYFDRKTREREDSTDGTEFTLGTPPIPVAIDINVHTKSFTQELRFSSKFGGPFELVAGAYYTRQRSILTVPPVNAPGLDAAGGFGFGSDILFSELIDTLSQEIAGYTEGTLHLGEKLYLIGGARVFKTRSGNFDETNGGLLFGGDQLIPKNLNSESGVIPKASVQYRFSPRNQAYVTAAKGFRPGGTNPALPEATGCGLELATLGRTGDASSYGSDHVWSYEAGFKTAPLRGVTANASVFRVDWSRIQQLNYLQCGFSFTANSGSARSQGVELSIDTQVIAGLRLGADFGFTDAKFTRDAPGTKFRDGDRVPEIPRYTLALNADWTHALGESRKVFFHADYRYISNSVSAVNAALDADGRLIPRFRSEYQLVNLRGGLGIGDVEVAVFTKNLFDKQASLGDPLPFGLPPVNYLRVAMNQPRTIGVEGRFRF